MLYSLSLFFFFNDTATTEIYTLSLHDALPISLKVAVSGSNESQSGRPVAPRVSASPSSSAKVFAGTMKLNGLSSVAVWRSEEHTSELQSRQYLVCRLLLEKKKQRRSKLLPPPS